MSRAQSAAKGAPEYLLRTGHRRLPSAPTARSDDVINEPARPEERLSAQERLRQWQTVWPFTVVLGALLCLVVVPYLTERRTRARWNEIVSVGDPARALMTEIELALTLETGDARAYVLTGASDAASDHLRARARRLQAEARLVSLARRLGPSVLQPLTALRAQLIPIDALRDSLYGGLIAREAYARRIAEHQQRFRTAIASADQVDAAIGAAIVRIGLEIQAAERTSKLLSALLVVVAFVASTVVARTGRRQLAVARLLDRRDRRQRAYGDTARRLNASTTRRDVVQTLLATGADATGVDGFIVELPRESSGHEDIDAAMRLRSRALVEERVEYDSSATARLSEEEGAGVFAIDVPPYVPLRQDGGTGLAIRVNTGNDTRGALMMIRADHDDTQSNADASYLEALGDLATAAFQRVQLVEALRESEERFRQIAENIREFVWLSDAAHGRLFYVNSAYTAIWGRSRESLYENPWSLLEGVHPEDQARVATAMSKMNREPYDIEFRVVRPTGEVRWVWSRGFPVTNERGETFRIAGITEDITERRRIAESRARLIRGFTHDVKNPLGAADGYLALLQDGLMGELQPSQRDAVGRARRSIERALELIRNVLDIARAEAGQVEIHRTTMNPATIAAEIVEEFRAQARDKGLTLDRARFDVLAPIESDSSRVRQILANLVSNAVKYTPSGGHVEVAVRIGANGDAPRPGDWVALEVSDDGPGISVEKQRTLFEEFARFDPEAAPGAGIGLAISQRIARALGGTITVQSQEGAGSTFTLWLPAPSRQSDRPGRAKTAE